MNYLLLVYEQAYYPSKTLTSINIQQENTYSETLKTFNTLLDTLEPSFIWEFLTKSFDLILSQQDNNSITAGSTIEQICGIINMLFDIFSFESTTATQSEMLYRLIKIINNNIEKLTPNQITLCLEILLKILKNVNLTDINPPLSICRPSIDYRHQLVDTDTEYDNEQTTFVDNEYSTDSSDKLQDPSIIAEQESLNEIERLLRQMVCKIEKQVYKLNNPSSDEKRTRLSTKTMVESINHIENSTKLYKIFFHRFIITYFIDKNQISLNDKFQSIYSIVQNKTNDNISTIFNRYQELNKFQLKLNENVDQYRIAFEDCCKLLIEFCCFPRQSSVNDQSILLKGIN
jgi:hypothetical protein